VREGKRARMRLHLEDTELIDFLEDQLDEAARREAERHLQECASCRSRFDTVSKVIAGLRAMPTDEFRVRLEERLRRAAEASSRLRDAKTFIPDTSLDSGARSRLGTLLLWALALGGILILVYGLRATLSSSFTRPLAVADPLAAAVQVAGDWVV